MKLLGNIKRKIAKDANGENVTCLEISEVVLVHCDFCQQPLSTRFKSHFFLINHLINYQIFHPKALFFKKPLIQSFLY